MYRARADAVSGTRVYAGGKWLQCIGNKNVSVGDYVWTDGRCVYGHLQESEQPKVITSPDDEGIPIIMVFDGKYCFYNYVSKLIPLKQPEDIGKIAIFSFMINDYRRAVFGARGVYEANHVNHVTPNFYATNIDRRGNSYKLVGTRTKIKIYKNGEEISTTDLTPLIEQQLAESMNSVPSRDGAHFDFQSPFSDYRAMGRFAFIENEDDWNVLLFLFTEAWNTLTGDEVIETPSGIAGTHTNSQTGGASYGSITAYLVNQTGCTEINSCQGSTWGLNSLRIPVLDGQAHIIDYIVRNSSHSYSASITQPNNDAKLQLQDGYYFIINNFPNFPDNMFCYPLFMKISIYTKSDRLLLTETFHTRSRITICKVGAKHLIGVRIGASFGVEIFDADTGYSISSTKEYSDMTGELYGNDKYTAYATGTPHVGEGLYLYDGKTLEKIADGNCLNDRLRPMPKFKGWQKRIQELK